MAVTRYKTAGSVINKAARELGLPQAADPFASEDPNHKQLVELYNTLGLGLLDAHEWHNLLVYHTLTTVGGQSAYDLPDDFHAITDDTPWDMTAKLPLNGPLTVQKWQERNAAVGAPSFIEFRLTPNQIVLAPTTAVPDGRSVTFFYKSRAWVRPGAVGLGNGDTLSVAGADEATQYGDYGLYDPLLMHYGLKYLWREAKGLTTEANLAAFLRALEGAKGRTRGAKTLIVAGRSSE